MTDTGERLQRSEQLIRDGKPDAAVTLLRDAIAQSTDQWQLYHALGEALLAARRDAEAIGAFMNTVRLKPELGSAYARIGTVYLGLGLPEAAVSWLQRALECATDSPEYSTSVSLAVAELQLGRRQQAAELLNSWVAAKPGDPVRRHMAVAILGEFTPPSASKAYVSQLFDTYADRFDQSLNRLNYRGPELVADILAKHIPIPQTGWDVLDAGCGTGLIGEVLRPLARQLVGVDLSQQMLQRAAKRGIYDDLQHAEISDSMTSNPDRYDLVTAADVLTYLGNLNEFCSAVQATLHNGGWLVSILEESAPEDAPVGYRLNRSGRFSHTEPYVRKSLERCGFSIRHLSRDPMRSEQGRPVPTLVVTAELLPFSGGGK